MSDDEALDVWAENMKLEGEILRLRAENEKLQWELDKALDTLVAHDAVCAENEKLRAALKPFADAYDDCRFEYSAALFKSSDLCAAVAAIRETNDGNDHKNRPTDPVDNPQRVSLRTLPD